MQISHPILHDPSVMRLAGAFMEAGFEFRSVGGFVRDVIMGVPHKDIDFCTPATPEQMIAIAEARNFRIVDTGSAHDTMTFVIEGESFEVTTLRIDTDTDGRHATVEFTTSFEEDAMRRDFTINAMSMDMYGNVYDYFGGIQDALADYPIVRFVGNAEDRIREDYLRILRYYRFVARFNTIINSEYSSIFNDSSIHEGLSKISKERVWVEISKILMSAGSKNVLDSLYDHGLNEPIGLPECSIIEDPIDDMSSVSEQVQDPITFLSILLRPANINGKQFAIDWKMSGGERDKLEWLLSHDPEEISVADLKRFLADGVRPEWVYSFARANYSWHICKDIEAWTIPIFPIKGQDLLDLGFAPGKEIGVWLVTMFRTWESSNYQLPKEHLLKLAANKGV